MALLNGCFCTYTFFSGTILVKTFLRWFKIIKDTEAVVDR